MWIALSVWALKELYSNFLGAQRETKEEIKNLKSITHTINQSHARVLEAINIITNETNIQKSKLMTQANDISNIKSQVEHLKHAHNCD